VAGARRLLDRGLASFERMIVDTCGLVAGGFGGALKRRQIDALAPDVVVALQREAECEHILRSYGDRPAIVRLRPRTGVRRRTATERRAHRERALDRYFARAREVSIDLSRVARGVMSADLEGVLVGLHDGAGETLGLGWIRGVDAAGGRLTICATVAGDSVVSVTVGRTTYRRDRAHGAAGRRVDDRRRGARAS
jgi:polynucleotide 5'-kinase involved in rRNA processing